MTHRAPIARGELHYGDRVDWVQPQFDAVIAPPLHLTVTVVGIMPRRRVYVRTDHGRCHIVQATTLHILGEDATDG